MPVLYLLCGCFLVLDSSVEHSVTVTRESVSEVGYGALVKPVVLDSL